MTESVPWSSHFTGLIRLIRRIETLILDIQLELEQRISEALCVEQFKSAIATIQLACDSSDTWTASIVKKQRCSQVFNSSR